MDTIKELFEKELSELYEELNSAEHKDISMHAIQIVSILNGIDQADLKSCITKLEAKIARLSDIARNNNTASFFLGYLCGTIDQKRRELIRNKKILAIEEFNKNNFNTSLDRQIISIIYRNPEIQNVKLSKETGINKLTLDRIMKKFYDASIVDYLRSGEFKYYYLTEYGKKYYKRLKDLT